MRLRDFAFFILLLAGDARRSFRIVGSHYDAQQHNNTVANGLDMSAAAQEAFIPRGSGTRVFRRVGTQARALPNRSRQDDLEPHSAAPWFRSSPRRANLDMSLPTGPKKDPEAREAGLNESKFSEKTAKTGVKDVWNSNSNWRWREDLRQWEEARKARPQKWGHRQRPQRPQPRSAAGSHGSAIGVGDPDAREAGLNESKFSEKTTKTGAEDVWNSNSNWRWRGDLRQWEEARKARPPKWGHRQRPQRPQPCSAAGSHGSAIGVGSVRALAQPPG